MSRKVQKRRKVQITLYLTGLLDLTLGKVQISQKVQQARQSKQEQILC